MIEIRHLTKRYGDNLAVNDLNLTLEPGNIYGFLGPNGAGKSTTMNIITGYIGATSGEVLINGHDINKEPEAAKKCIGYLPELPPVYGDMKVIEYLRFVAELKQLNQHTQTADIRQVMDLTKLEPVKDRLIRNLSKGYRQRVGLAQALMGLPEIIILDEPTVGLDPKQIIEIRDLMKSLREKHTVILSSHILQEISAVCDHVFIISRGKLVASDTMDHLEEKMSGAQQLKVTVRGDEEAVSGLKALPDVKTFRALEIKNKDEKSVKNEKELADASKESVSEADVQNPEEMKADVLAAKEGEGNTEDPVESGVLKKSRGNHIDSDIGTADKKKQEMRLEITAKPGADIRADIFMYCAENDLVLLEMTSMMKSLEDVFLELTEGKEVQ